MSSPRRPNVISKLPADLQEKLDDFVRRRGLYVAARATNISVRTLERVVFGGFARTDAVERMVVKLRAWIAAGADENPSFSARRTA